MHHSYRKGTFLALSICFLVASLALVWHHHDISMQWTTCSICKVKSSLPGAISKIKADAPPVIAVQQPDAMEIYSVVSATVPDDQHFLPVFILSFAHSNKAPPPPALS
jgi:hypothetical protein